MQCDTALKVLTLSLSRKHFPGGSPTWGLVFVKNLVWVVKNPRSSQHQALLLSIDGASASQKYLPDSRALGKVNLSPRGFT